MNTVIPGRDPWDEVIADPRIWHFAFHAIPELPELLVTGHERSYFDYSLDLLGGRPDAVDDATRESFVNAYLRPEALTTGFDWYRSLAEDAKHNRWHKDVATLILYVRGDADHRPIDPYLAGIRAVGASNVRGAVIEGSGEFLPQEQPRQLITVLSAFALEVTGLY